MPKTLTVFTPAYNRAGTLPRTYESLLRQTSHDFEWLIIDDGSTDDTAELVKSWQKDNRIPIRYIYQKNQGMHGAHNTAYRNIRTELNTCIDSDDWMPPHAVERIVDFWKRNKREDIAGIIGLDMREDGSVIGKGFPDGLKTTTLQGYYATGGAGDKKIVYRTDVITRYPEYPLFEGERYVGLAYKYMLVDRDYELLVLNEPLVIVEYQADGSSNSMYRQYWNNPRGFAFFRKTEMMTTKSMKRRFMSCIHYVNSSIRARNKRYIKESPYPLLTMLATPAGALLYAYVRHKVKAGSKMNVR